MADSLKQNDSKADQSNAGFNTHSNTKSNTDSNDCPTTDSSDNDAHNHDNAPNDHDANPPNRFDVPLNHEGWWNTKVCSNNTLKLNACLNVQVFLLLTIDRVLLVDFLTGDTAADGCISFACVKYDESETNFPIRKNTVSFMKCYAFIRQFHAYTYNQFYNRTYVIRRRTLSGKITYYVTRDFKADVRDKYQGSMKQLEVDVKMSYQKHLTDACNRERKQ